MYNIEIVFTKYRAPERWRDLPHRNYTTGKNIMYICV